jgi:hypothetical protein
MPYATHTYGSTEYAGSLGGSAAGAAPAGTEYPVAAEDRTVLLRLQADAVVPYEDREVKVPSATVDPVMFVKNSGATKDYSFNWSEILEVGETIATSSWDGGGLTSSSATWNGDVTTTFLAGGTTGTVYVCTNTITTSLGRTYARQFKVSVEAT